MLVKSLALFAAALAATSGVLFAAPRARAEAPADADVLHHPLAELPAGQPTALTCVILADWEARGFWVAVRPLGAAGAWTRLPLLRTAGREFAATLPAELVQPPGLEYFIGGAARDGAERVAFASAEHPQPVLVVGETAATRHAERLARHGGRTSALRADGEVSFFGRRQAGDAGGVTEPWTDWMWQLDVEYTHRFLETLYDIRFGVEIARAHLPELPLAGGGTAPVTDGRRDAGINLGYGEVNVELTRWFGFGGRLLLGASDQGFALGAGAVARIGHLGGTRLELGGELLTDLGNRGWLGFTWTTIPRVPMALTVELTERPGGEDGATGTRLLYDLAVEVTPGFSVTGRFGWAVRSAGIEGGPIAGLGARFEY